MGMENMCLNVLDYPDEFAELLRRMTDDYLAYCRWLQSEGLLTLNHDICDVWPTTHGFTSQLPAPGFDGKVRTEDLWLGMDSTGDHRGLPADVRRCVFQALSADGLLLRAVELRLLRACGQGLAVGGNPSRAL